MAILETNQLHKRYGAVRALNDVSITVHSGQVFGLLGPNGSGKTTLLGIALGVIRPTSGSFLWKGEPPHKSVRQQIGAILETPLFYPYLSASRNLEIVAQIKKVSHTRISEVLEQTGLGNRANDKFKTYSLGMKQRLAIASALLCNPDILVLDEPTNGLDPQGIAEIRQLIIEIANTGKTIILASHLLDEVQKVCTHFAVLRQGKLLHQGAVADIHKASSVLEVMADHPQIKQALENHPEVIKVSLEGNKHIVYLQQGLNAQALNQYLFDQGIVVNHLVAQTQALEKEFLKILAENHD